MAQRRLFVAQKSVFSTFHDHFLVFSCSSKGIEKFYEDLKPNTSHKHS
jgi:hypothetical protein